MNSVEIQTQVEQKKTRGRPKKTDTPINYYQTDYKKNKLTHCDICNSDIYKYNIDAHNQTNKHRLKVFESQLEPHH